LAQALVALGIPATVCLTGTWLRQNPEGLAFLLAHPTLFGFANHGARHVAPVPGHGSLFGVPAAADLDAVAAEVAEGAALHVHGVDREQRGVAGLQHAAALELFDSMPSKAGSGRPIAASASAAAFAAAAAAAETAQLPMLWLGRHFQRACVAPRAWASFRFRCLPSTLVAQPAVAC
jgi:hypothetical protein